MTVVVIDSSIRLLASSLPPHVLEQLLAALRIPNPAKDAALREKLYGARDMPDSVELYHRDGDELVLPRGFYGQLRQGLEAYGVEVEWIDERRDYEFLPLTKEPGEDGTREALDPIVLRDYQEPAVRALVEYEQGCLDMPTGAGKTNACLEAIRRVDQPALIIVDKTTLADQWRERIRETLGVEAGYVGESKTDVRPICVALRQSLWSRFNELDEPSWSLLGLVEGSFWDLWGVVVFDEVHHLPSDTLQDLSQRFPARFRWGLSATPQRDAELWPVTRAIIGPIIHQTTAEEAEGALVRPRVRILQSDFEFDYRPTQIVDEVSLETGEVVLGRGGRPRQIRVQNNWTEMVGALCSDVDRNLMVAEEVKRLVSEGRRVLVVSRRKKHLNEIYAAIREVDDQLCLLMLVGGMGEKEADDVRQCVEDRPCCLLSTVAEEGLDLPRLDAVVVPFPFRNAQILVQIVGRVLRASPGKSDAIVVDVADKNVYLLRSQFRARAMFYRSSGYEVEEVPRLVVSE